MKILITGSQGFIGHSVGRAVAQAGYEVLGVGRSSQPRRDWPGRYVQADVAQTDLSALISEFVPDTVVHAAGPASVAGSLAAPLDDFHGSVAAWANVLDSIRRSEHKPLVVFPSSAAVYGNPARLPVSESEPIAPISPYGFHKAACELLAREYASCFGLRVLICRLFSVFGESQRRLLVWDVYEKLSGPDPVVWLEGTGEEVRDYVHVEEVSSAILALSKSCGALGSHGACVVVNLASGEQVRALDLADRMRDLLASRKAIRCRGCTRPGDPSRWCADVSYLHRLIPSWQPAPFLTRLRTCVEVWQAQSERAFCND